MALGNDMFKLIRCFYDLLLKREILMDDDGKEINAGSIYKDGWNCIKI